ncbi:hypothetical protein ACLIN3_27580 (plasmid) [Pseudomonas orientalis]|uniref:hypothetical protein n=1 Tax=Pseudomonas orientalis TaxID=76758 RepID=UPI0039888939
MSDYTLATGRQITSEVLMKLKAEALPDLPMACKTCPSAMWQITGKPDQPETVTVRCYCPVMHTFTWDNINREEIMDCDRLYQEEEEESRGPARPDDESDLPPFLRKQKEQERLESQAEAHAPDLGDE